MSFIIAKVAITAALIVAISEIAKHSDRWGGLVAALPLTTVFVICWMYFEGAGDKKIAAHMSYTLLYVLPTLPMFFVFPMLIERFGFFAALFVGVVLTAGLLLVVDRFFRILV